MKKITTNKSVDPTSFMTINDTSKYTGFSCYSIRKGCIDGNVPHVFVGGKYLIDVEAFLEMQHKAAAESLASNYFAS